MKYKRENFIVDSGFTGFMAIPQNSRLYVDTIENKHFTEIWTGLNSSREVSYNYQQHNLKIGDFNQIGLASYIDSFNHFLIGNELFLRMKSLSIFQIKTYTSRKQYRLRKIVKPHFPIFQIFDLDTLMEKQ